MSRNKSSPIVSTIIVGGATFISRLLGFLRQSVVSYFFGATGTADVLNFVFTIPNNLRKLLAEGALSSAFIPSLTRSHEDDPTLGKSKDLTRSLLTFQLIVIVPIILASVIFAQPLIQFIGPFPDPQQIILATELFRWFILYLLFISVSSVLMGVQNSHHQFLIPSLVPLFFSIAVISGLVIFYESLGVHAQTVGILVGGLGQVILQLPSFFKLGYSLKPKVHFLTEDFKKVLKKYAPTISTSIIFMISQQISMSLAATLTIGSVTTFNNALVFWQLPQGVFAASIATVLFPQMSRQVATGNRVGLGETVNQGLQGLLFFLLPSTIFIQFLGLEMIHLAYQHGAYTYESTVMATEILIILAWGLFGVGAFGFLQRLFYSEQNYRTPFYVSLGAVVADLVISIGLMNTSLGVRALALGNVTAYTIGFLLFLYLAQKKMDSFKFKSLGIFTGKLFLALILPVVFLGLTDYYWPISFIQEASGIHWIRFFVRSLSALGLFLLMSVILKIDFFRYLKRNKNEKK
ncbi:MAG: murein biosynthesis integral membrane protein MurJ [Spirochaetes bacterium GWB1_48_6]|nr:MAG: murein biosynthesis integral membrane protein MurJ [Spirochaetes bacterium GWB1_48_6]